MLSIIFLLQIHFLKKLLGFHGILIAIYDSSEELLYLSRNYTNHLKKPINRVKQTTGTIMY